ncbi:MAG: hypothetical protein L6422_00940 [Candidatus Marinimicrobia bacterium]|nr:hypothetical protein [Candidatus Neomarinimicrobiota bacterium]
MEKRNGKSEQKFAGDIERVVEYAKKDLATLLEGKTLAYRKKLGNIAALVPGFSFAYLIALDPSLAPIIRKIGKMVGSAVVADFVKSLDLEGIITEIAGIIDLAKLGATGIIKISDEHFILRVTECADCGGTPDLGRPLCAFDEGLIDGAISTKLGKDVSVKEEECVKEGLKYCDFSIKIVG